MSIEQGATAKPTFRFQNLQIWQRASDITWCLFRIADALEERKLFRFAEQMRGAALSITNNIAEGSGSTSKKEFSRYLDIARNSVFENANMILVFGREKLIASADQETVLKELDELSRMITTFARSLKE